MEETKKPLTCCVERHLVDSGLCLALYSKLYQLTHGEIGKGEYFADLDKLAEFFGKRYDVIWRACKMLVHLGFFEELGKNGHHVRYRIYGHAEWAEKYPGQCYQAIKMPWEDGTGDPLARKLFAASAGTPWYRNMLTGMRELWGDDDTIVKEFRDWLAAGNGRWDKGQPETEEDWKRARGKFLRHVSQLLRGAKQP